MTNESNPSYTYSRSDYQEHYLLCIFIADAIAEDEASLPTLRDKLIQMDPDDLFDAIGGEWNYIVLSMFAKSEFLLAIDRNSRWGTKYYDRYKAQVDDMLDDAGEVFLGKRTMRRFPDHLFDADNVPSDPISYILWEVMRAARDTRAPFVPRRELPANST